MKLYEARWQEYASTLLKLCNLSHIEVKYPKDIIIFYMYLTRFRDHGSPDLVVQVVQSLVDALKSFTYEV